jgi:aldehyde:ferredoxin oxidoreductase
MTFMEKKAALNLHHYVVGALSAVTGEDYPENYVNDLGTAVLEIERRFNKGAGMTEKDDRLPKFFSEEKFGPGQFVYDVPEADLDSVHIK